MQVERHALLLLFEMDFMNLGNKEGVCGLTTIISEEPNFKDAFYSATVFINEGEKNPIISPLYMCIIT
jgi:hypothetical protein